MIIIINEIQNSKFLFFDNYVGLQSFTALICDSLICDTKKIN